jgi:hypothetical protein
MARISNPLKTGFSKKVRDFCPINRLCGNVGSRGEMEKAVEVT